MNEATDQMTTGARLADPAEVLDIAALRFAWGRVALYERLDLRLSAAGIYGLFGRNGSGKPTLLKLIAGLLTPAAGRIKALGYEPRQRAAGFLAEVYLLPEEFHLPNLTPRQLLDNQAAFYPRFDAALYGEYLSELRVPAGQRFADMSLGQKKKAAIAFALAAQTPLLLMDEPTNGLDIESRVQFRRLMTRPEQRARAVLISTHQAHDLESILTHLWFIDQGRIVLDMSMPEIARRLSMGVAASVAALPAADRLLYQTPVGAQWAWIARAEDAASDAPASASVQLELLYQAISLQPEAMLTALGASGEKAP
jgi:ABC-2 type transport system ATP-binding protein